MKKLIFLTGIALWALSPFFVYGQLLDPVDYAIIEAPDTVRAAETFEVTVEASIDDNWHLYSILNDLDAGPFPTQFSTPLSTMSIEGVVSETEATIAYDPNFDSDLGWHSNTAQFKIPVRIDERVQGTQPIKLEVLYQVCDDRSCLPPKTKQVEGEVVVLAGVSDSPFTNNLDSNEISVLWIAEFLFFLATASLTIFFVYKLIRRKILKNSSDQA